MTAGNKDKSINPTRSIEANPAPGRVCTGNTLLEDQIEALKQSEKKLLDKTRDFQTIVETAREGIWKIDGQSNTVFINKRITEMLGYTQEEIFQKKVTEFMFPEDVSEHATQIKERKQGKAAHYERRLRCKDGSTLYVLLSAVPLLNKIGKYEGSFAVLTDITDRKQTEEKLRVREQQFSLVFENSKDAILWADCETGLLLRCNKAALQMFERTKEELIGQSQTILHPADKEQEYRNIFEQSAREQQWAVLEAEIITKSGKIRFVEISSTVICVGQKKIIQGIFHDITQRKRNEANLKISEERYRALFERSRDALLTVAPPLWLFTSGNPAAIEMFEARDEADLLSRTPWEYSPQFQPDGRDSNKKAKEMIEKAMDEGSHYFEWMHQRVSGQEFPATVLLTRLEINGQSFLQATVRDETEKKKLETRLMMEDRLANIGMLATGVAGEINTPLDQIISNIESLAKNLLKIDCSKGLRPTQLEAFIDTAQQALVGTHRIKVITRRLGTFLRVEASELSPVNLRHNIQRVINMALSEIKRSAQLVKDLQFVPLVWASEAKLSQVFLNLVLNAVQSIDSGDINNNRITIRTWRSGTDVFVEVKDTGKGIDLETLDHIFELSYSVARGTSTGTGLGLPICKSIINELGGDIQVASEVGKGSSFIVRLPAMEGNPEES